MVENLLLEEEEEELTYQPRSLEKSLTKPKKEKKKKSLWDRMFKKHKLKKPNKVAVIYLRRNGSAQPMEVESKGGFFNINNKTYHEDRDCIYRLGKENYPFAIIPEWNVTPIGKIKWEEKDMQEKFSTLQDHVIKGIRHAERVRSGESSDSKLNTKSLIVMGIIAIIGLAFLFQYVG